ncbi:hypothetical protein [Martelella endophytica]|uniref:Uncharacterized protein n=1 Tax=Martelella endophytica TaxID=1486262 RepID=A0A0D5LV19_MAREN|nr:hypothetical protein [Martelella endophytica]AJY47800.1 hypothetical protein TM49_22360 [Martelella endophytica]
MIERRFWFALLVAAIPGVAEAETITFDPAVGSERTYHLEISMHSGFTDSDGFYDNSFVSALTRFSVSGRDDDGAISMDVFPLWFAYDEGSRVTSTAYGDAPDDLAALMREGFTARIDPDHHVLEDFAPRGDADMPAAMLAQMRDQLGQPVPPVEIEVEKGWTTTATLPGVADVEITVSAVTPEAVYLRYEGASKDARLSGVSVLARDTGWVERSVMTYDMRIRPGADDERFLRQTVAMADADSPFPLYTHAFRGKPEWHDMPTYPFASITPPPEPDMIFTGEPGEADKHGRTYTLSFTHSAAAGSNIGRFTVDDLRLFDGDTELPTQFIANMPVTVPESGGRFRTVSQVRPIGLGDVRDDLENATELRARVDWYPSEPFTLTLNPDADGNASATRNGASAQLRPTDDGYELLLSGKTWDFFGLSFPEGSAVKGQVYAADSGADWLTPEESQARRLALPDYSAIRVALRAGSIPEKIEIRVGRHAEKPAATREVVFRTKRGKRLDPDTEPETWALYPDGEPPALDTTMPESLDVAALRFRLATTQAKHCKAGLDAPAQLSGHDLVFERQADGKTGTTTFRLQTDDGIRTHFYGHEPVTALLECDTALEWDDATQTLDPERPWLIDPASLGAETTMTIAAFNHRFRIVDADGTALALVSPGETPLTSEDTLASALFEDGHIRAAGRPERILEAHTTPDAATRRFDIRFPELPEPREDAQ